MQIFQKLFQNRESRSIFIRQVSDSFRLFITSVPNYYVLQSYDESGDSINFAFFCEKIPGFRGSKNFFPFFVHLSSSWQDLLYLSKERSWHDCKEFTI